MSLPVPRMLARHAGYRLGLVFDGMRSTLWLGCGRESRPDSVAHGRHRPAAARTVRRRLGQSAQVAATEQHGVSSIAIAAPVGLHLESSIGERPGPQPIMTMASVRRSIRCFHVVRALSQLAGKPRLSCGGTPQGVVGIAGESPYRQTTSPCQCFQQIAQSDPAAGRRVCCGSTRTVRGRDPLTPRLASDPPNTNDAGILTLGAYAVAFIDLPHGGGTRINGHWRSCRMRQAYRVQESGLWERRHSPMLTKSRRFRRIIPSSRVD